MTLAEFPIYFSLFVSLYMLTLFYIAFFEGLEEDAKRKYENKSLPKVAVIVPAYNEEDTIVGTVNSLLELDYPKDKLKIYVVDDGSKDKTWQVLQKYLSNKQVKLLKKENGGKASAMNYAFARLDSATELVGILDADSFVEKNALLETVKIFQNDNSVYAVTPAIKIWNPNKITRFLQNAEYNLSIWLRKAFDNLGTIFIIPGPFSFYRKEVLEKLGPWKHAHGTEDLEMGLRFQKNGYKVANTTKAIVYTVSPDTLTKLYRQRLRWAYGFLNNAIDYKDLFFKGANRALAFFILPASLITIFFALYIFFYGIYSVFKLVFEKAMIWKEVGVQWSLSAPDLFFVNFSLLAWLAVVVTFAASLASFLGDRASGKKTLRFKDLLSYIALYGFVAPLWLTASVWRTILRREAKWVKVNK